MFAPHGLPWWDGAVWGNIIASLLTGAVVLLNGHFILRRIRRLHREHLRQQNLNHNEVTTLLASLHEKVDKQGAK